MAYGYYVKRETEPYRGQRVYTPHGRVSHELEWGSSPNDTCAPALCGRVTYPELWRGTGNQVEIECAASLPRCKLCDVVRKRRTAEFLES